MRRDTPACPVLLGKTPDGDWYFNNTAVHLITVAPSGQGKSTAQVIPNLWTYTGSMFVLDVKGELYDETAHIRRDLHHQRVLTFNIESPENSNFFNPIDTIRSGRFLWRDAMGLASLIIVPEKKDAHWSERATELLALVIADLVHQIGSGEDERGTLSRVASICSSLKPQDGSEIHDIFARMLNTDVPQIEDSAADFNSLSEKEFSSIRSTLKRNLVAWKDEDIMDLTEKTTEGWTPLMLGDTPATVYIIIPPDQLDILASVLRVMVGLHVKAAIQSGRHFKQPTLYMLDEFLSLKYMEPIAQAFQLGRDYGIKLWLFVQSIHRLREHWNAWQDMFINSGANCFMNISDSETERFVRARTVVSRSTMQKIDLRGEGDNLLAPGAIYKPEFDNRVIVLESGEEPQLLDKAFHFQVGDDEFQKLINHFLSNF